MKQKQIINKKRKEDGIDVRYKIIDKKQSKFITN